MTVSVTLNDGRQVGRVGRHAARRLFAVACLQLASAAAAAADGLRRAASTSPRRAVAPKVRAAVDARDVEKRDAL